MPILQALGTDPAKSEVLEKEYNTVQAIKSATQNTTLQEIEANLRDTQSAWFAKDFNTYGARTSGCSLYTLDAIHEYITHHENASPVLKDIENKMIILYRTKGLDKLALIPSLFEKINEWLNDDTLSEEELVLAKTFLIFSKTLHLKLTNLSAAESMAINDNKRSELVEGLTIIANNAKKAIIKIKPEEQQKSIESLLSEQLPENPIRTKNKQTRHDQFQAIQSDLEQRETLLRELHALKSMQDLFNANDNKITGREYFGSLIGVKMDDPSLQQEMHQRHEWFEQILMACDQEEQIAWREEIKHITSPSEAEQHENNVLNTLSSAFYLPIAAARMLHQVGFIQQALQTEQGQAATSFINDLLATPDGRRKDAFKELIQERINCVYNTIAKIDTLQQEPPTQDQIHLKEQLQFTTAKQVAILAEKTSLLNRLYQQDKQLGDYLHQHNKMSVKFINKICEHFRLKGPSGCQGVREAKSYRNSIKELRDELTKGENPQERLRELIQKVRELEHGVDTLMHTQKEIHGRFSKFVHGVRQKSTSDSESVMDANSTHSNDTSPSTARRNSH